jgi:hypothetical protein
LLRAKRVAFRFRAGALPRCGNRIFWGCIS